MAKTFRTYLPEQNLLLPASLREWLPDDHLSYFVSDVVDQLDLSAIERMYEEEDRGQPPYHPRMMTKVLLYGYCVGVFSSRRIQKRLVEDVAFRVLAAGNEPDFRTISAEFAVKCKNEPNYVLHLQSDSNFGTILKCERYSGVTKIFLTR